MHGYNFTERVRKVLAMSREEALRLSHEYVGTEHILLGLVREGEGVAAAALAGLKIDPRAITERIEATVKRGRSRQQSPDLPYTSRAKKCLELAMSAARDLRHSYVGTEHLLLGLIHEEKGIAAQVLADLGVTFNDTRSEILRLLGTDTMGTSRGSGRLPRLESAAAPMPDSTEGGPTRARGQVGSIPLSDWATDRARAVISRARAAAVNRHSRDIEPEHLLIALLQEDGGMAATVLAHLQVDRVALARAAAGAVEETLATDEPFELGLPYSPATEAALRHAFHAARVGRDRRVGTDHLLEGLLLEENTPAARLLVDNGVTAEAIREERARIVG